MNGTAQTETVIQSPIYWGTSLNPFENVIASVSGSFKLAQDTYLKVQPYMWYGFGNGGWSQIILDETGTALKSRSSGTSLRGGAKLTSTATATRWTRWFAWVAPASPRHKRPGVTGRAEQPRSSNHYLKFGVWFERSKHRPDPACGAA